MNRNEAKQLAKNVTLDELRQMFLSAKNLITDWTLPSRPNKGISLGAEFNILSAGFEKYKSADDIHILGKTNMIWAFGEYLPNYSKPCRQPKSEIKVHHQEPKLDNFNP